MDAKNALVRAAADGLLSGLALLVSTTMACSSKQAMSVTAPMETSTSSGASPSSPSRPLSTPPIGIASEDPQPKDCCRGKNECKGKSGCATSTNDCRGKNECKGTGSSCDDVEDVGPPSPTPARPKRR
jgi:hypothetical protein